MRILISDYSGHPFQVQLSRELARRGHTVRHVHFSGFQTPNGNRVRQPDDPAGFDVVGVTLDQPFAKSSFVRRRQQEIAVGKAIAAEIVQFAPDLVVSGNAPLDTQREIMTAARRCGARFVFWLQDIYSAAISRVVPAKLPGLGHLVAWWYRRLEFAMLRSSDRVIAIAEDFRAILLERGVPTERIAVIENWAPLDELPELPRGNAWAEANYPREGVRFVYSGTLGYKHNPHWLLALARAMPAAQVSVFSEGEVAAELARKARDLALSNLTVRSWVPFAELPAMLAGADVLVAFIEPDASVYSVPSKILTYLAAGRPILCALPAENLAAQSIAASKAGFVCDGQATETFLALAQRLAGDVQLRAELGANGRAHALQAFAIAPIADRFLAAVGGAE
jgi:colanic acid biosynthesis glycosyl transferase WcaI